jgi:hypothetical protein
MGEKSVILKDHAYSATLRSHPHRPRNVHDDAVANEDPPFIRALEACNKAE